MVPLYTNCGHTSHMDNYGIVVDNTRMCAHCFSKHASCEQVNSAEHMQDMVVIEYSYLWRQGLILAAAQHLAQALQLFELPAQHAQRAALRALHKQKVLAVAHRRVYLQGTHVVMRSLGSLYNRKPHSKAAASP